MNAAPDRVVTLEQDPARRFEPHRGKALRIKVDKGEHYGTSMEFAFKKRTGVEPDDLGRLENNRWYAIEQYVKLNTSGRNDGILRGWVNGALAFEKTDVRMRDVDALKVESVWLNV